MRCFTRVTDLGSWATGTDPAERTPQAPARRVLTDPTLTGRNQEAPHAALGELIVPDVAAVEQRVTAGAAAAGAGHPRRLSAK
ncbi:hypothetical protein ACWERI_36225 [Streptomyces collinus]